MSRLELRVEKSLGGFRLEAEVDCPTRGIVALFGRSGAGKTTLVNLLAGLLKPDSGYIAVDGQVLFDSARGIDVPPERRRLGYVFQEGRLFPHLTVESNLLYGWRRAPRDERPVAFKPVVELLGLGPLLRRRPFALSGGEKQRVALGRALLASPRLLLMDEPLAALDQARREEVLPFIEALRDELAIPIVYISHSMEEILRLSDSIVLLSEGRVVAEGPIEELTSRLDLRPLTGRYEAGAVLLVSVARQDETYDLTELVFAGGRLLVPRIEAELGTHLRLRIRARDVALSLAPPQGLSIQNVLRAVVADIGGEEGPQVDLRLDAGGAALWARITRRSLVELGLTRGSEVYALVKSAAIDRHSLGRPTAAGRFLEPSRGRG